MAEEKVKFKKPRPNFKVILERQKKMEDDEKFAISDSLQEYIDTVSKKAGYQNQDKLDKANIRQEVINFVDNYTIADLDSIKGMEYDEALQLQNSTEKKIQEFEGLGVLNKQEIAFIKATVGETNKRLGEVLGVSTRLKFAFRDLKKELKPLKLAARLGITRIPIIGKRIERAIRAEEEGESEALRIKRGLRKREARLGRKEGDMGTLETPSETQQTATTAKQMTSQILGIDSSNKPDLFADKEQRIEEERESDNQFDTTSTILEKILIESELTNELLGGKKGKKGLDDKDKGGFSLLEVFGLKKMYDFVKAGRLAAIGTSLTAFGSSLATFTGVIGAAFSLPAFLAFLNRPQGPEEMAEMKDQSKTYALTGEAATEDDYEQQDNARQMAIDKDERNKLIARGDIDESVTLEKYSKAKKEAEVAPRVTSWWSGKIKDNEVERVLQVLSNNTTNEGSISYNTSSTDLSSISNTTSAKMDNVNELSNTGINRSVNAVDTGAPVIINNNNQVNDNSSNTNKTEYGSTTIGSLNPDNKVKEFANYS